MAKTDESIWVVEYLLKSGKWLFDEASTCREDLICDHLDAIDEHKARVRRYVPAHESQGAEQADSAAAEFPKWISVKDRLPEAPGYYLTWGSCGPEVLHFAFRWRADVTHWMPLPEAPK